MEVLVPFALRQGWIEGIGDRDHSLATGARSGEREKGERSGHKRM